MWAFKGKTSVNTPYFRRTSSAETEYMRFTNEEIISNDYAWLAVMCWKVLVKLIGIRVGGRTMIHVSLFEVWMEVDRRRRESS